MPVEPTMNHSPSSRLFLPLLLCAALPAQQPTDAGDQALVIKTADPEVADRVADMFDAPATELPKLETGDSYVMTVGSDGKLKTTTEHGAGSFLQVRAKPAALASIFADQIQQANQQASMMAGFAAGNLGISPAELNKFVDAVFAFPQQLQGIDVDVRGSAANGFDGKVAIAAAPDGWFATFVATLDANEAGAPQVQRPDAVLHLVTNLAREALTQAAQPFLPFIVGPGAPEKEQKAKFGAMMKDVVAHYDGTLDLAVTADAGTKLVVGLVDAEKLASIMGSDDYKTWRRTSSESNPMADVEIKDAAVTHRDVAMTKTHTEVSTPMGQQDQTTFSGIAGQYMFVAGSEADAKSLVDTVLDDQLKRAPLAKGALLTLTAKVAEMVRTMSQGMADGEGLPAQLDLALTRDGSALHFSFKVGM